MKNAIVIATAMILCFSQAGWSKSPGSISVQQARLAAERSRIVEQTEIAMENIFRKTGNPMGYDVEGAWKEALLLEPADLKTDEIVIRPLHTPSGQEFFGILPLLPEDAELRGPWQKILENNRGAKMTRGRLGTKSLVVIVIVDVPMTETWRGLNAIRETVRVMETLENPDPADPKNQKAFLQERVAIEAMATAFSTVQAMIIGGERLQKLVIQEAERLQLCFGATKIYPPIEAGLHKAELNQIFGPALSRFEEEERASLLRASAFFHTVQDDLNDEEVFQKEELFFSTAEEQKILR